jgi:hypothetical protein
MFRNDIDSIEQTGEQRVGGVWLLANSAIALNLTAIPVACELDDSLKIEIRAKGSESAGHFAQFNLVVNGKYCDGAFTTAKDSVFSFVVSQPDSGLQSIIIYFDNDLVHHGHDRNLNIVSVKVGDYETEINERNIFLIKEDGKYSNGFESQAGDMKNYLVQLGVNPEKVKIISFEPFIRNQTLAAARAFIKSEYFNDISSVNIVSSGTHSRRSWITYQRTLGKEVAVGLIHFEQSDFKKDTVNNDISQFFLLAEEAVSYVINWIFFSVGLL